jgi:CRP-like cAMP-binding protein
MHDGLALLSELNESDISSILEFSHEQQVIANEVIIKEETLPESLYVVLGGLVGIYVSSVGAQRLATLGPRELLGEISYIENSPASATVVAIENSLLLVLPRKSLDARMAEDPSFASRLNKSFALISSRRLRERVETLGRLPKGKSAVRKLSKIGGAPSLRRWMRSKN